MDLTPSDEQRLLRESADRFVNETYTADHRRRVAGDPLGFSADIWKQFAELGWLALPIAEAHGGLGGGAVEVGILMEAFGRGLVSEPYLSTVVIGASLISECGTEAQKQALLPGYRRRLAASGIRAFGTSGALRSRRRSDRGKEDAGRLAPRRQQDRRARRQRRQASSSRPASMMAPANLASSACSWCRKARAGLPLRDYPRLGGGRLQPRTQRRATSRRRPARRWRRRVARDRSRDRSRDGGAWPEAVGIMQTLLDQTLEYTKIRKQFGRPLSANQVIRHRLADMAMQCDEARSMALRAALMADAERPHVQPGAASRKPRSASARAFVAEQSVQLHGRMGVTEELDVGLFQAAARLRHAVRRQRPSLSPLRRPRRPRRPGLIRSAIHGSHLQRRRARLRAGSPRSSSRQPHAGNETRHRADALGVFRSWTSAWPGSALHKKGWGAPGWPVDHGGPDWTPAQRWIFEANAPAPACRMST